MAMTTRRGKGEKLNWDEMDDNLERVGLYAMTEANNLVSKDFLLNGIRSISFTNGSGTITGSNFLDSTNPNGLSYGSRFYVEYQGILYFAALDTIESDTSATLLEIIEFDPATGEYSTNLGVVWPFNSGEYNVFLSKNILDGNMEMTMIGSGNVALGDQDGNIVLGNNNFTNYNSLTQVLGYSNIIKGQSNICIGGNNKTDNENGSQGGCTFIGHSNQVITTGSGIPQNSIIIGRGNSVLEDNNQVRNHIIASESCQIDSSGSYNMLLGSYGCVLGGTNSTINKVTAIGFYQEQLDFLVLNNCVVVPRLLVYEIPVFEDDAAAGVGGLIAGMAYRNAAGQAFYKLP